MTGWRTGSSCLRGTRVHPGRSKLCRGRGWRRAGVNAPEPGEDGEFCDAGFYNRKKKKVHPVPHELKPSGGR